MRNNYRSLQVAALIAVITPTFAAAELSYSPVLPQFGGTNGQALSVLQFEKQMRDAEIAAIAAEEARRQRLIDEEANRVTAADRLVTSITNVLNVRLSQIAVDSILERESGDIPLSDSIRIQWVRVDGNLELSVIETGVDPVVITLPIF